MTVWDDGNDVLAVAINNILKSHKPATGMVVSMGQTCQCGYWTGEERAGITRPAGVNGDGLDWHRSVLIAKAATDMLR